MFPLQAGEAVDIILLKQLTMGESLTDAFQHDQRMLGASIADEYDYVTYGTAYSADTVVPSEGEKKERVKMTISFGGLLMQLTCPHQALEDLHIDDKVYCLVRKKRS